MGGWKIRLFKHEGYCRLFRPKCVHWQVTKTPAGFWEGDGLFGVVFD